MKKKIISLILAGTMILTMAPGMALAKGAPSGAAPLAAAAERGDDTTGTEDDTDANDPAGSPVITVTDNKLTIGQVASFPEEFKPEHYHNALVVNINKANLDAEKTYTLKATVAKKDDTTSADVSSSFQLRGVTGKASDETEQSEYTDLSQGMEIAGQTNQEIYVYALTTAGWYTNAGKGDYTVTFTLSPADSSDEDNEEAVTGTATITIDSLAFVNDLILREALRTALVDKAGTPSPENLKTVTSLDLSYKNTFSHKIQDLYGIQPFTGLKTLKLSGNAIRDLSCLSNHPALEELDLSGNEIETIDPLGTIPTLKKLDLSNNGYTDNGTELKLKQIDPLQQLTSLEELKLANNEIVDTGAFDTLSNLKTLDVSGNQIANIGGFKGLTSLTTLDASNNKIADLGTIAIMEGTSATLEDINLSNNLIQDLGGLEKCTAITKLNVSDNQIEDLGTLENLTAIEDLDVSDNCISDILPITGLSSLKNLDVSNNAISNIQVITEDEDGNPVVSNPLAELTSLETLNIQGNAIPAEQLDAFNSDGGDSSVTITKDENTALPSKINITISGEGTVKAAGKTVTSVVLIKSDEEKEFTFTPAEDYEIKDVAVNGASNGAITSYKFSGVNDDQTLAVTFTKKSTPSTGGNGGGGTPAPTPAKPEISTGDGYTAALSTDGTKATITVADGYVLKDVLVNGVSKGAVTTVEGLKTGDKVEIVVEKKAQPEDPNAELKAGIQATTITADSKTAKGYIYLSWEKSGNYDVDGYQIYRQDTKDGEFQPYAKTQKTTFGNTAKLKKGNTYSYKIRGYKTVDGEEIWTKESNVTSKKLTQTHAEYLKKGVQNTKISIYSKSAKGSVTITWKKQAGFKVDGYQVYRSDKKTTGFKKMTSRTTMKYKNTKGLKKGKKYYYKVRGYRTVDGKTVYTKWSKTIYRTAK